MSRAGMDRKYYSRAEVAQKLGLSLRQVNRLLQRAALEPAQFVDGGRIMVTAASLRILESQAKLRGRQAIDKMFRRTP